MPKPQKSARRSNRVDIACLVPFEVPDARAKLLACFLELADRFPVTSEQTETIEHDLKWVITPPFTNPTCIACQQPGMWLFAHDCCSVAEKVRKRFVKRTNGNHWVVDRWVFFDSNGESVDNRCFSIGNQPTADDCGCDSSCENAKENPLADLSLENAPSSF